MRSRIRISDATPFMSRNVSHAMDMGSRDNVAKNPPPTM
jgi:hypothetical protein